MDTLSGSKRALS